MRDFNIKNTVNQWEINIHYSLLRIEKDVLNFRSPAIEFFELLLIHCAFFAWVRIPSSSKAVNKDIDQPMKWILMAKQLSGIHRISM